MDHYFVIFFKIVQFLKTHWVIVEHILFIRIISVVYKCLKLFNSNTDLSIKSFINDEVYILRTSNGTLKCLIIKISPFRCNVNNRIVSNHLIYLHNKSLYKVSQISNQTEQYKF